MKCFDNAGIFLEFFISYLLSDQKLAKSRLFLAKKCLRLALELTTSELLAVVLTARPLDLLILDSSSNLIQNNTCCNKCYFAFYCYGYCVYSKHVYLVAFLSIEILNEPPYMQYGKEAINNRIYIL